MKEQKAVRNPAIDMIRCFALFCVVSVHFFLNSGFYSQTVSGKTMYLMMLLRSFFMICVPLFITLTGYLECHKKICASYYKKIVRILGIYILCSVACVLYKVFVLNADIGVLSFFSGFFSYSNAPYSWYVEMYIGLFVMAPFLNVLYSNLASKKQKQLLLLTLIFVTSLPAIFNIFEFNISWFLNPSSSRNYVQILPAFWTKMYPLTYYFMGCYIREYKLNLKKRYILLLSLALFFIGGTFNYYRSAGSVFVQGEWQDYNGPAQVVMTFLVFSFFANLKFSKCPCFVSKFFKTISGLCFGAYLTSWIFDSYFYNILNSKITTVTERFKYFALVVAAVFVCSILLSGIIDLIYRLIEWICKKISGFVIKRPKNQPQETVSGKTHEIFSKTP